MKNVYIPVAVPRPNQLGYTNLVVSVEWNEKTDVMGFTVDGTRKEFYRRGRTMFSTWTEGCAHIRKEGLPLND